ncbi:MAG TPA: hypothetical protein PLO53_11075, partial [Candidatus Hydrogenedentes bacterium]|nr:hypothetical protein [Candidatus Hydrogenedentota bacterium]
MPNLCLSRRLLSVLVLLAWLMSSLLCASAGAQSAPRRGDEPVWQTTAAPEWQSGSAFTEPYPPGENEEGGLRERQDNSSSEPGKSAQTAGPSGVPSQAAAAGTPGMPPGKEAGPVDPVIQRLNTAYQEGTGTESGNGGGGESAPSVFGMLLRAVFALALVLGLFFLFVKGLKIMRSMTPAGSSPSVATMRISVADRIPLGSRHSV